MPKLQHSLTTKEQMLAIPTSRQEGAKHCVEFLRTLLRYASITPEECGIYEVIKQSMESLGFKFLHIDANGVRNLFAYREGNLDSDKRAHTNTESNNAHFCFMGHIDVVPVGEGWSVEPFGAILQDGYVWGRGAQDMKAGVAAFICALCDFLRDYDVSIQNGATPKPLPTLSVLLTSDEEGEGTFGTRFVLERLKELHLIPKNAIVAEPTCVQTLGDMVKIGRRGSINGVLTIFGKQGHVAYPSKCINPIEALGATLGALAGKQLDSGNAHFAPSQLVITDIRGGLEVVNVTPSELRIMFNVRNSPLTNLASLQAYLERIIEEIEGRCTGVRCELKLNVSAKPFISAADSSLVRTLCSGIQATCGKTPEFSTSGGTSDARFCAEYGIEVVEFGVCNDRIHSVDERVCVTEVEGLYAVFYDFLEQYCKLETL